MLRSFIITSDLCNELSISQLHLNLWHIKDRQFIVDIGLNISLSVVMLASKQNIKITLHTPFAIKNGDVESLYNLMLMDDVLQLVFNDEVSSKQYITNNQNNHNVAHIINFKSGKNILYLNPLIEIMDCNKINMSLQLTNMNLSCQTSDNISSYIRIRYNIDITKSSCIYFENRVFHNHEHYDFRFNEPRSFEVNDENVYSQLMEIKEIMIFIIKPIYYKIMLNADRYFRYIRILEKEKEGWVKYLPPINKSKKNYLVYNWRIDATANMPSPKYYEMLLSFEAEKSDITKQLYLGLSIGMISFIILILPNYSDVFQLLGKYSNVIKQAMTVIGGILFTLFLGVISNAVWSYLKLKFTARGK